MVDLLKDEAEAREFIEKVLNVYPLIDDEIYILLLNTRKKYCREELTRSEEVLNREIIRDNITDKILRKIKKLSVIDGVYVDRNTLKNVPINCMAAFILLDPRSMLKGYSEFQSDINRWIYESFKGELIDLTRYRKLDIKLFSAIHKNRSRGLFWVIDIDKKDEDILDKVASLLEGNIRHIEETHGGYHIVADRNDQTGRIIHEKIRGHIDFVEVLKDPMNPIPGTLQGGFLVKGIRRELWK